MELITLKKIAREYAAKAKLCINDFPESEAKKSLLQLVDFVVDRKK
jgi:geranylgeranyl pyrophosphate synthase